MARPSGLYLRASFRPRPVSHSGYIGRSDATPSATTPPARADKEPATAIKRLAEGFPKAGRRRLGGMPECRGTLVTRASPRRAVPLCCCLLPEQEGSGGRQGPLQDLPHRRMPEGETAALEPKQSTLHETIDLLVHIHWVRSDQGGQRFD